MGRKDNALLTGVGRTLKSNLTFSSGVFHHSFVLSQGTAKQVISNLTSPTTSTPLTQCVLPWNFLAEQSSGHGLPNSTGGTSPIQSQQGKKPSRY